MPHVDEQLVKAIAAQVLAAIRSAQATGVPNAPADIHAPIGICTGDYSKFPELAHLRTAAPIVNLAAPSPVPMPPADPARYDDTLGLLTAGVSVPPPHPNRPAAPLYPASNSPANQLDDTLGLLNANPAQSSAPVYKGVITAAQLKGTTGTIRLAAGAMLTPLAADYVKDKNITVEREGDVPTAGAQRIQGDARAWFWWIQGACSSVAKLADIHEQRLLPSQLPPTAEMLPRVIRQLASNVKQGRIAGGILFVPSAARAICYANRCANLRAIVGTCDQAVEEGLNEIAANVLVLEYPHQGLKSMLAMTEQFINTPRSLAFPVQRDLQELGNCL